MESTQKGPGRPRGSGKQDATLKLFDGVNPAFSIACDDLESDSDFSGDAAPGPVGGGGGGVFAPAELPELNDEEVLKALWREANDRSIPAAARIQATAKVQQMRERMSGVVQAVDVPAELASFIDLVRDKTPAECDKLL